MAAAAPISGRLRLFLLFLIPTLWGCGSPPSPEEPLFLMAAEALGPEAHKERLKVVNPILVALDNPRLPERVLEDFREQGYEVFGGSGEEDPEKATYYFTVPRPLGNDEYQLRIHVSMGSRFGARERGDTWWLVTGSCKDRCRIVEVQAVGNRSWQ